MKIATAAQMRLLDRRTIEEIGVPGVCLMEAAGQALARTCIDRVGGDARGRRIGVVCGKGNNGGDGFVAARHLAAAGARVAVFLTADPASFSGDAAVHFRPLERMDVAIGRAGGFSDRDLDLLVDCLLGTGARGAPTGAVADAIAAMNASSIPIVAADLPSGVDADTGETPGQAIRATHTVTFAAPKPGLLLFPGALCAGGWEVANIGIPRALLVDLPLAYITEEWVRTHLPARPQGRDINKGAFGVLLVVAGSRGMAGAAVLTALSALRTGAGLVHLALPESVVPLAATLAPEVVLHPLPETPEGTHGGEGAVEKTLALAARADAVALGPGLGTGEALRAFVGAIVGQVAHPLVSDADALNALAGDWESLRKREAATVLTPHPGEMGRLLGIPTVEVQQDRLRAVGQAATRSGAVTFLKGARTLIATPEGETFFNRCGSPALATAGSGDVLTGIIGAFLAGGSTASEAARLGAFVHALAGETAARRIGDAGALASEIRDFLPEILGSLRRPGPSIDCEVRV